MGIRHGLALATLVASAIPARASPVEVFGLTSRRAAQANAGAASVDDASAVYYDPAGLVARPALELEVGMLGATSHLAVGDHYASLSDPIGFQLAMRAPLPITGPFQDRIVVGVALHLLPDKVARFIAPPPDQPFYLQYGDRLSRIVVLPGLALQLSHNLAIGIAGNVLAGLTGSITAAEGSTRAIDARVDERVPTIARAIAGLTWQPVRAWRAALVYRQRFEIPFATQSTTEVAGEPIDLDLSASTQFTPDEFVAGFAWFGDKLTASLDLQYSLWSNYPGPYVRVDSALPLVGTVPAQPPSVPFKDTYAVRAGLELEAVGMMFRGGYGFETSPVPRLQRGVTNLLDGPRHTLAVGAGYPFELGGKSMRLDAHLQLQLVRSRLITKTLYDGSGTYDSFGSLIDEDANAPGFQTSNPGYPTLRSGGEVVSGGLTLEVKL
jgi:hypothetical protein